MTQGYYRPPGGGGGNFMGGVNRILGHITPTVKYLVIANVAMFILCAVFPLLFDWLSLVPFAVYGKFQLWRLFTSMFLHANLSHILVNMIVLWSFGAPLERVWGRNRFLLYYLICGLGSAIACVPFYALAGEPLVNIVGASGAVMALLIAHFFLFPNSTVMLMMVFPVKMKTFIIIIIAVEWFSMISYIGGSAASKVASIAHLGGMAMGYFYLRGLMDFRALWKRIKSRKKPRAYRVIDGEDGDPPRGPWLH